MFNIAGSETTSWTLGNITYHLLTQPEVWKKLKDELETVVKDGRIEETATTELERLPYLVSTATVTGRPELNLVECRNQGRPSPILWRCWTVVQDFSRQAAAYQRWQERLEHTRRRLSLILPSSLFYIDPI